MSLRRLLTALVALALLWGPLAHQTGAAMAATPPDHAMQMVAKGHCDEQPGKSHDKLPAKDCCAAMLTAIQAQANVSLDPHSLAPIPTPVEMLEALRGFTSKLATPPPRS